MGDVIADWPRDRMLSLLTLGRRHGLSETTLLDGTTSSLTQLADPAHRTGVQDEHLVVRNLLAHTDPALPLPLEAGLDFHLLAVGSWGQAIRTSPDLGSAIAFAFGSARSLPTSVQVSAQVSGDQLLIDLDDSGLPEDVRVFITIRNLVFMAMTARELLGHQLPLHAVSAHAAEPPYSAALDEFCGVPVSWDAAQTQITTDLAWMAAPLPGADPEGHAAAVQECYRMLARHRDRNGVSARVRSSLRDLPEDLRSGEVTAALLATSLDVSERSLRRQLASEGTSFSELLTQDRLHRAQHLLAAGQSIDEVSRMLGYSEPAAFSRAFKRWAGTPPDAWRRSAPGADRT